MHKTECPLCERPEVPKQLRTGGSLLRTIECPTCGTFQISEEVLSSRELLKNGRYLLSAESRRIHERRKTKEIPLFEITEEGLDAIYIRLHHMRELRVQEKLDLFLDHLYMKTEYFGQKVQFNYETDYPLFWAKNKHEGRSIFLLASKSKYIDALESGGKLCLAAEAFNYLEEKRSVVQNHHAFVAMAFNDRMDRVWRQAIEPAITQCGFKPILVKQEDFDGKICDFIIAQINKCGFMIADFTDHRPNVYFEAGYALGLGKKVLFSCEESQIDNCHFDTRQYNHITWNTPSEFRVKLENRIAAVIGPGTRSVGALNREYK